MQRTLNHAVRVSGIGLHLGQKAEVVLHPAPTNTGIVFYPKGDPTKSIQALYTNVVKETVGFCTRLQDKASGYSIATVEHLLAALSAKGITNIRIEMTGPEIPIMDGSSKEFDHAIESVGIRIQDLHQPTISIIRPVQVVKKDKAAYLLPRPANTELTVSVEVDFKTKQLPRQWFHFPLSDFSTSVASARTFTFQEEIATLQSMGLAKGGSLDNAIVYENGNPINQDGHRFPDEWVRHKGLDVVGDLALAGMPIFGHFVGICPGHALTHELLDELFSDPSNYTVNK